MPNEDVEAMKEFMSVLTDVKVSVAEMNGKMDRVMDTTDNTRATVEKMRVDLDKTKEVANSAEARSLMNEKNIEKIEQNSKKTNVALISIVGAFVLQIIFFLLTFNFN